MAKISILSRTVIDDGRRSPGDTKRRISMNLTTRVTRKIEEIPREDWERVFPDVLESYSFFKSLDESGFEQFSFYYIMAYDGDTAVGAAPCFFLKYSLDTSVVGPARRAINLVKKRFPGFLTVRALACGVPMGRGYIGMAGSKREVVTAILKKMEDVAAHERAPIMAFKDFSHNDSDALSALTDRGFFRIESLPYAEMDITFKDFEGYLMGLSGASRYDLRRKFKKAEAVARVEMEIVENPGDDIFSEMYGLYTQIVDKHEMGFEVVPKDFFRNTARNMPGKTKFFLWRVDGKLAAFLFALTANGVFIDYYLGLDYAVAHKYHLFFLKFRDVMNWCLENNIKKYEIGISGYEPKRRLGFDFTPLHIYAKHRNRIINPLFRILAHFLKFENFDPDLKAVKRSMNEKRASDVKGIRPDSLKRRTRQHSPALHEERVGSDRD